MYKITQYTKDQAKKLGVKVKPSSKKGKKIDVFKNGEIVASVGAIGYGDYPTFLEQERKKKVEKGYAAKRRRLYKARHEKYRHIKGTDSYYADKLLW